MSRKFTYRLLTSGVIVILIACVLSLIIFLPRGKQSQAQGAKLSVASDFASAGETIMVTGFEYPAAAKVQVYVKDRANGVVSARANEGGFFNVPVKLPKRYISGPVYMYAVSNNLTTRARLNFVKPVVAYHAPVRRSTVASFKGAGFIANETVNYVLTAGDNKITGTRTTDNQGHFTVALKLPDMPLNSKAVLAVTDKLSSKPVTVKAYYAPQIQLSSFAGAVSKRLHVTGRGYAGGEWVSIVFQGGQVGFAHTNRDGDFSASFRIPTTAVVSSYYNDVQAIGQRSEVTASDSFQVLPSVAATTNTVVPGERVTVAGSQFTPEKHVRIVLFSPDQGVSSVGTELQNTSIDNDGKFRINFSIPLNTVRKKVYSVVYIDVGTGLNVNTSFRVV